jgi:hypothetical protein
MVRHAGMQACCHENRSSNQTSHINEIVNLMEFGFANFWQKAMVLQDFDPMEHDIQEFVGLCEVCYEKQESHALVVEAVKGALKGRGKSSMEDEPK